MESTETISRIIIAIIPAIISGIASVVCAIYAKELKQVVTNISNNVTVSPTNPIQVNTPDIKLPQIMINQNGQKLDNTIISAMTNVVINVHFVIYNLNVEKSETEIIKACSILLLYLDNGNNNIKECCKEFCEKISHTETMELRKYFADNIGDFEINCRRYIYNANKDK